MPGKDEEFYLGNSFALEVDSVAVALFTEVSGLESATDVTEIVQQMKDGKTWKRPKLGLNEDLGSKENNIVIPDAELAVEPELRLRERSLGFGASTIEPLDLKKVPNYDIAAQNARQISEGTVNGTVYAAAKDWGTTGFAVNTDNPPLARKVAAAPLCLFTSVDIDNAHYYPGARILDSK